MIKGLRKVIEAWRPPADQPMAEAGPAIPPGERVYAIGDIHGRDDLFAAMAAAIEADDAARALARTTVILLGDLVDRGPASAAVIARALDWRARRRVRLVAGNHEEMFLAALDDPAALRHFLRIGGLETVLSYGIDPAAFARATLDQAQALIAAAIPPEHRAFLEQAEPLVRSGGYLFTHAGIRPGVALAAQSAEDLRWIREPFLGSAADHGVVVVHGHTITPDAAVCANRIGIDTGAYRSGRLTALCLEGARRWLIEARLDGIGTRPA